MLVAFGILAPSSSMSLSSESLSSRSIAPLLSGGEERPGSFGASGSGSGSVPAITSADMTVLHAVCSVLSCCASYVVADDSGQGCGGGLGIATNSRLSAVHLQ